MSNSKKITKEKFIYFLFLITSFISAYLLFQVQPMISKYLLPIFGGSSSVWTVSALVFQILLIFGYFYGFWLVRKPAKFQVRIHLILILFIILFQLFVSYNWPSIILPDKHYSGINNLIPEISLIKAVALAVGATYFVLATTTNVIQSWYFRFFKGQSPYWLFRVSNLGSIIGLVSYPFFVEYVIDLKLQSWIWYFTFLAYAGVLYLISTKIHLGEKSSGVLQNPKNLSKEKPKTKDYIRWLSLSFVPSLTMLAITNNLTQGITPIPFLWVIPLSLYLLSFIFGFTDIGLWKKNIIAISLTLSLCAIFLRTTENLGFVFLYPQLVVYTLTLFFCGTLFHNALYESKPSPFYLQHFYLTISFGGAFGGLFVGIVSPILFKGYWEADLALLSNLAFVVWLFRKNSNFPQRLLFQKFIKYSVGLPLIAAVTTILIPTVLVGFKNSVYSSRNFYGLLKVKKEADTLSLFSGRILHGAQIRSEADQYLPTTYYSDSSGIGLFMAKYHEANPQKKTKIGVLGLGVGTLAIFCDQDDEITFYEINPEVILAANKYFTYLKKCSSTKTVLGDARLSLEKGIMEGRREKFDILVMDTFTDDSIPLHLLTIEAFQSYLVRLEDGGVIVVNISNAFLDLSKPLKKVAENLNLEMKLIKHRPSGNPLIAGSDWIILSYDEQLLEIDTKDQTEIFDKQNISSTDLWTDNYSSILKVLKF